MFRIYQVYFNVITYILSDFNKVCKCFLKKISKKIEKNAVAERKNDFFACFYIEIGQFENVYL